MAETLTFSPVTATDIIQRTQNTASYIDDSIGPTWAFRVGCTSTRLSSGGVTSYEYEWKDVAIRFPNVQIPPESTIRSVKLALKVQANQTYLPIQSQVYFVNEDDAVPPNSLIDFQGLNLTSAVAWTLNEGSLGVFTDVETPELRSILNTILSRPGWASGNAVVAVLKIDRTATLARGDFLNPFLEGNGGLPDGVNLVVEYSPPYYEGIISESFTVSDQSIGEEDLSNKNKVTAIFINPFYNALPDGYQPYGEEGTYTVIWDEDYAGSEVSVDDVVAQSTAEAQTGTPDISTGTTIANLGKLTGKWYWEVTATRATHLTGDAVSPDTPPSLSVGVAANAVALEQKLGMDSYGYGYARDGSFLNAGAAETTVGTNLTFDDGDIISVAMDADSGKLWFAKNGEWLESGDPENGTGEIFTLPSMEMFASVTTAGAGFDDGSGSYLVDTTLTANFGDSDFAYDVPSAFLPYNQNVDDYSGNISEDVGLSDAFEVSAEYGTIPADAEGSLTEGATLSDSMSGLLPGDSEIEESGVAGESFTVADSISADTADRGLTEGVSVSDAIVADSPNRSMPEGVTLDDTLSSADSVINPATSEDVELSDTIEGGKLLDDSDYPDDDVTTDDAITVERELAAQFTNETVTSADEVVGGISKGKLLEESSQIFETLGFGWIKALTSTAQITETVIVESAWEINDILGAREAVSCKRAGTENVESTLGMFGQSMIAQLFNESVTSTADAVEAITYLHQMVSVANSTMAATGTPSVGVTFNPKVAEAVAVTGLLSVFNTIGKTLSESPDIADAATLTWPKTISDSFAIADAPTMQWVAMHILTESLAATETAIGLFNFSDTIAETLEAGATLTLQQMLQESVTDILDFGITIVLDDETWECWVLNTNAFHPSVYSGFDFNSYAVYNNQAFGCKEDGIYRLDGATDNGTTINAGIVLPETDFGTLREKRFRKAYFGISGTSPSIRMESETGDVTYTITDSRANLQRNQKGKEWTLKLQGFDSLDQIDLVPIILTR